MECLKWAEGEDTIQSKNEGYKIQWNRILRQKLRKSLRIVTRDFSNIVLA